MIFMIKRCKFCGKEFETKYSRKQYCDGPHYMLCPVCGKQYEVAESYLLNKPPQCCSKECRSILRKQTSMNKYNCVVPGNSVSARLKAKITMNKNYGVDYAMQSDEIKQKAQASFKTTIWNRKYSNIIPEDISCSDMVVFVLKEDYAEKFIKEYSKSMLIPAKLYTGVVKDDILYRCISFNPYGNHKLIIVQDCSLPYYNVIDGDLKIFKHIQSTFEISEIGIDV